MRATGKTQASESDLGVHIELFLEEPSAEAFMRDFLPKLLPVGVTWNPMFFKASPTC